MDSLCNWSDVWLQDSRSEQQVERPSLFMKEEIMLQPQPHIDLLIRWVFSLRNQNWYCPIYTQNWLTASFCSFLAEINTAKQKKQQWSSTYQLQSHHQENSRKAVSHSPLLKVSCLKIPKCFIVEFKYLIKE